MRYSEIMALRFTNDFIFRYVFGREENKPLLLDLVNAVLADAGGRPVISLELQNPVNLRDAAWGKETVLDIKALGEDRCQFDIEIQVSGNPNFINRSLYYWSQLYSRQLEKGHEYAKLRPVVCINLLDFTLFDDTAENHHHYVITDALDPQRHLTDDFQIHFIELAKPSIREAPLKWWAELLENAGREGVDMKVLLAKDPSISKAYEDFERCTQDRDIRELAYARERFQLDQRSNLGEARREGRAEGLEEGLEKGMKEGKKEGSALTKLEIAKAMLAQGIDPALVESTTGLSRNELVKLNIKNIL